MMAADVHVRLSVATFCVILSISHVGSEGSLYTAKDDVVLLNSDNFYTVVPRSQNAWFIEFYSSWCGHCIRFAPTWKQLGTETAGWSGLMRLGGVDCAQEENLALCREYNIESYPTLKFVNAFSDKKDHGTVYSGSREMLFLKHSIIEFLQNITDEGLRPPTLPRLAPLRSMEDIWVDVTSSIRHTVIIFEEADSDLGKELLLDFAPQTDLVFRRMMKEHVSKFGIREFPSLFLIEKEGTFKKIADHQNRTGFNEALNKVLGVASENDAEHLLHHQRSKSAGMAMARSDLVYLGDLESGLHYSLHQEVAGHKNISGPKLEALKAYVSVLAKYLPVSEKAVRYLKVVSAWIQQQEKPLTGAAWLQHINHQQSADAQLTTVIEWIGCEGSSTTYRGYPCSLWTVFHTLTVNSVIDAGQMEDFDPLEVLIAMRDYIKHFFGCRECSEHFMKMAITVEKEVKTPTDSIMWLWRAHNKANLRLHGDITEDPKHPKIQFPSNVQCPSCHILHRGMSAFDEIQVLLFLKKMFAHSQIKQRDGRSESQNLQQTRTVRKNDLLKFAQVREERNLKRASDIKGVYKTVVDTVNVERRVEHLRNAEVKTRSRGHSSHVHMAWGLNTIDISMCVLFYIVCTGILILLYFHLAQNHRVNIWSMIKRPFRKTDRVRI